MSIHWSIPAGRRFELYVRWSYYIMLLVVCIALAPGVGMAFMGSFFPPFPDAPVGQELRPVLLGVLLLVTLAYMAALITCMFMTARVALERLIGKPSRFSRGLLLAWIVLLIFTVLSTIAIGEMYQLVVILVAIAMGSFAPAFTARRLLILCLVVTVACVLFTLTVCLMLALPLESAVLSLLFGLNAAWSLPWGGWLTAWSLRFALELQRAGEARSELALAEERLRIARDLHDVFGRTLAAISVKSELAAQLSGRGLHERAAAEMTAIRTLADEAGVEVRRVVRGELRTSWQGELEGAKALLGSAGIRCEVSGEPVPQGQAAPFAMVLREAVTNVLRHSAATCVTITARSGPGGTRLEIENDGANQPGTAGGTGLRSMTGRLRDAGGTLVVHRDGGHFRLTAWLPAGSTHADEGAPRAEGTAPGGAHGLRHGARVSRGDDAVPGGALGSRHGARASRAEGAVRHVAGAAGQPGSGASRVPAARSLPAGQRVVRPTPVAVRTSAATSRAAGAGPADSSRERGRHVASRAAGGGGADAGDGGAGDAASRASSFRQWREEPHQHAVRTRYHGEHRKGGMP